MDRGYVKLWRKTLDSGLLQHSTAWQLFGYLLLNASHRPHKKIVNGKVFELEAGQLVFSRSDAAAKLELGERQVRTALSILEKLEIVTSRPTNKGSIISFVNWDRYNGERPAPDQQSDQHPTSTRPASGPASSNINKNERILNTPPYPPASGGSDPGEEFQMQEPGEPGACEIESSDRQNDADEISPAGKKKRKPVLTAYSPDFEAFWKAYPRKSGKDAAWKAWQKRRHEIPALPELAAILARQSHCEQWQRDGGQFIPHPATWLNQGRWQDEVEETQGWTPKPANW